jgi:hypothetical protein
MKILALEYKLPNVTVEGFQQYTRDEARKVWALECPSMGEAREILSTFPYVQNKLITFELIPLKAYPGFERLFP